MAPEIAARARHPWLEIALAGINVETSNPLSADPGALTWTGAFAPFGVANESGQRIRAQLPLHGRNHAMPAVQIETADARWMAAFRHEQPALEVREAVHRWRQPMARRSREPSEASRQTRPPGRAPPNGSPDSAMYTAPSSSNVTLVGNDRCCATELQARTVTSGHGGSARSRVGHKRPSPPAAASSVSTTAPDSCARCAPWGESAAR